MFWIIWTYLIITAYFAWSFLGQTVSMEDNEFIATYGRFTHSMLAVIAAATWPVMLPVTIWNHYNV